MTRPSFQVGASVSVLTANGCSSLRHRELRRRLDVGDERADLTVGPAGAGGRHVAVELRRVLAVHEQITQAREIRQSPVAGDGRSDEALAVRAVTLGADGRPLLFPEVG